MNPVVLNDTPDKLSGFPPGYRDPFIDGASVVFPIPDPGTLVWGKDWRLRRFRLVSVAFRAVLVFMFLFYWFGSASFVFAACVGYFYFFYSFYDDIKSGFLNVVTALAARRAVVFANKGLTYENRLVEVED